MTLDYEQILSGILTALAIPALGLLGAAVRYLYKISTSLIRMIEEWEGVKKKIVLFDTALLTLGELVEDRDADRKVLHGLTTWHNLVKDKFK